MKVRVDVLKNAMLLCLNRLAPEGHDELEVPDGDLWEIPYEKVFDLTQTPDSFDVQNMSWSYEQVVRVAKGGPGIPTTLVHLSVILRAVGEKY